MAPDTSLTSTLATSAKTEATMSDRIPSERTFPLDSSLKIRSHAQPLPTRT